ncbi:MAG: NADH-quinone oxidoreductase subunit M [Pseudohongiellaceae bacterium]
MILIGLICILFIGGLLAWASESLDSAYPRVVALVTVVLELAIIVMLLLSGSDSSTWFASFSAEWIPRFGVSFYVAADGLSVLMIALTGILGLIAIGAAWSEISERTGFFYFNLLWTLAGVIGVFTALDLFLFFFFWEVMLIPMYFIIAIWGHENKNYAAMKFFIFTQVSGMLMLIAIVMMAYLHLGQFGNISFNYHDLLRVEVSSRYEFWIMMGFFIGFATKLPSVPFHSWLPDAHSQAPTAGSVILAGILLKTGAYGLIRFTLPLFPEASLDFAPFAMALAGFSILYCAKVAFGQNDIKRLIAYTSVSHMGFVTLGIYAWNEQALQGALMTMLAHGLSAAALFMLAGGLQHRIHTRNMDEMGGFWVYAPRMAVVTLFFSVAALGMPGLGNFVGEFLSLLGAFQASVSATVAAAFGLIFASVYSLWVIQKVFQGEYKEGNFERSKLSDLNSREMSYFAIMIVGLVWMGMYPQTFIDIAEPVFARLLNDTGTTIGIVGGGG